MNRTLLLLTVLAGFLGTTLLWADESDDKIKAQKKAAEANWALLDEGEAASLETPHLLIYAPKSLEPRLKTLGAALEKGYDTASKALKVNAEMDKWWAGKLTVYVLPERAQFVAFVRRVEKRRLEDEEYGSVRVDGDVPHAAAGPGKTNTDPGAEAQAVQQVAAAILQRKAGPKVPLPGWLLDGFGRATFYRTTAPGVVSADRNLVRKAWMNGKTAKDAWGGGLSGAEGLAVQASLAEYLAYGPGATQFASLLSGFRPDEGQERKETAQAFAAAEIKPDELEKNWWAWAQKQR
jgi:hypothetical protein